ncbi:hypothetical protein [Cysteiniphilum halobium]|uniref:hypothetical protein n=1 Tax=Cysteiniphilum halobium TaxID=2219059 RepID=UPI003F85FD87
MQLTKQQIKTINTTKFDYEIGQTVYVVKKPYNRDSYDIEQKKIKSIDFVLSYTAWSNDPKVQLYYRTSDYDGIHSYEPDVFTNYADAQNCVLERLKKAKEQHELEKSINKNNDE